MIAYTVVFPSLLAQIFYIARVALIGANRAGLFINLVPIFGTPLSILLLGEALPPLPCARHRAGARRHLAGRAQRAEDGDLTPHQAPATSKCSGLAERIALWALTCARTSSGNGASR